MAQISLRAYVEYIEDRLARDALTEVVAQCRHVLESYPKFIDAYRLLARALMEQEKNQDALDLFQRVLSADPNDFVAHIGISEVYHEISSLDQAIWHLERAYEQVPSNIDLQEAIKDLYAERDGQAPRKIHLTGGALARMYANGKIFDQALLELRKVLASDPERLDLLVLMANTLWNYHQYVEAGKLAGEIHRRLPNSIDANALLARMWLQFGKSAEAQPFLNNVKQLDPYRYYEIEQGEEAPSDAFKLHMLDYTADRHASEIGAADWVSEIGAIAKERGVTGPLPVDEPPVAERASSITDIFGQVEPEPEPTEPQETPDWLSDALTSTSIPDEGETYTPAEQPPPLPANQPDWLSEALGSAGVATQMADETSPSQDTDPDQAWAQEEPGPIQESAIETILSSASERPDWMQEVLGAAASPAPPSPAVNTEMPEWIQEVGIAPASASDTSGAADSGDMPDWLAETLGQPDERLTEAPPDVSGGDMPDWLAETLGAGQPPAQSTPTAEAITPDWMDDTLSQSVAETPFVGAAQPLDNDPPSDLLADLPADRNAPGWLDDILSGEPEDALPAGRIERAQTEVVSDDWLDEFLGSDTPDVGPQTDEKWLSDLGSEPVADEIAEPEPVDLAAVTLPPGTLETWSQATDRIAVGGADPIVLPSEPARASDQAGELPDWLATRGNAKADASRTDSEDEPGGDSDALPDWLATASPSGEPASKEHQTNEEDDSLPDWLQGGSS